ncbi:Thiol-disulfide isomerase or thioredoxin [Epilithonimonas bovis DSM 19482]|uniref:Thiol-disulfide isomerase or thioredoxin n=1 Tax=Epilithonimonas bovis DSM 19482 TaxID=1121284 RepID=A0A1U7Q003_9FLAO|nr:thioredoxin family protein [Epilithonimonas bovis]MDN5627370.1 thioredoxin family protein [Weeksellaceae bacterium]SIT97488.1 Thiol-disulfide isomerase or thioredoxin [Epilithonimonas bovis DSM 19482]
MKKTIPLFSFFLLTLITSCAQRVIVNREVESQKDGKMLLGTQTLDQFRKEPFKTWFDEEYNRYQIDQSSLAELKKEKLNSYTLVVFVGSWCGDSHREFPRLIKILDALKYNTEKMQIIAVNRKKESPAGEEGLYNISRVPTIIVKKYGKEIGRITEMPETGFLEKDLLNILKKDNSSLFK